MATILPFELRDRAQRTTCCTLSTSWLDAQAVIDEIMASLADDAQYTTETPHLILINYEVAREMTEEWKHTIEMATGLQIRCSQNLGTYHYWLIRLNPDFVETFYKYS